MKRKIIEIDESLCNGCGQCVTGCAEGALEIQDGVAKIVADHFCDGLGACIGHCPTGALQIIERDAPEFDEAAVEERLAELKQQEKGCRPGGCPGSAAMSLLAPQASPDSGAPQAANPPLTPCQQANLPGIQAPAAGSALSSWPIKLRLVPPNAPFLNGARLLLTSDCVPPAFPAFHSAFLPGRVALLGCPKFDDVDSYLEKLTAILNANDIKDVTVLQMEVPCCAGMSRLAARAVALSGKDVPVTQVVVGRMGDVKSVDVIDTRKIPFGMAR
ncbi:iron-sulfur binding protein [Solidesulfovibrio carbinoliphilus subsp. oakridgensis]|uniref:Iron-sulfur binding protein n=1 Tax=Solidesulfovibrio carbinoliphilus subsp. oakridgensis TaxID=694327 RepID=G7Q6S8_9BACT|nr:4Fe-4S dicluster domain-containing protein [Solidesulfovibrio carbinoliphilus]EHJ48013.1 iron-sulfur binding protein [Solidesulfovibrio carbinoliphilus subsp. oakridgensis]